MGFRPYGRGLAGAGLVFALAFAGLAADGEFDGDYEFSIATGLYSSKGNWALTVGTVDVTMAVDYDERGNLTGTASAADVEFPLKGKGRLKKGVHRVVFKSADPKRAKLSVKATIDGEAGTLQGTGTLLIPTAGVSVKKAAVSGTIPAGASDVLAVALTLTEDARRALTGSCRIVVPDGRDFSSLARGKVKAKKAVVVKLSTLDRLLVLKGNLAENVVTGSAKLKLPGYKAKGVPFVLDLVEDYIPPDSEPPMNTTGTGFIEKGGADEYTDPVTLALSASDDTGVVGYRVEETESASPPADPDPEAPGWVEFPALATWADRPPYTFLGSYEEGTQVFLHVWFKDAAGNVSAPASDSVSYVSEVFTRDFEVGLGDWNATNGVWEVGVPTSGPGDAHSGTQVAATVLGGSYPDYTSSTLVGAVFTLPDPGPLETLRVRWWHWFSFADGDQGTLRVAEEVSPGVHGPFSIVASNSGSGGLWSEREADLGAYAGKTIVIGFALEQAAYSGRSTGWYLDDVVVSSGPILDLGAAGALSWDFEDGYGDWWASNGGWEVGEPTTGPGVAHSGSAVAATRLATNYVDYTSSSLVSPPIRLPELGTGETIECTYWHWFSIAGGDRGAVRVQERTGPGAWGTTTELRSHTGGSGVWSRASVMLTPYAGKTVRLQFSLLQAAYSGASTGWYVDDVAIEKK